MLVKAKEELEAEKRELVRTLERRSSEVEHLNGMDRYSSCCLFKVIISVPCLFSLVLTTVLPDDLKQLNDKLVEVSTSKLALQVNVDELETVQVNIKVSYISVNFYIRLYSTLLLVLSCFKTTVF